MEIHQERHPNGERALIQAGRTGRRSSTAPPRWPSAAAARAQCSRASAPTAAATSAPHRLLRVKAPSRNAQPKKKMTHGAEDNADVVGEHAVDGAAGNDARKMEEKSAKRGAVSGRQARHQRLQRPRLVGEPCKKEKKIIKNRCQTTNPSLSHTQSHRAKLRGASTHGRRR